MASKGDTPKKHVKAGEQPTASVNDNCRLCCCPLKIKYGDFKKTSHISTQNLFKVPKREGFANETLAEMCSKIGLTIERSGSLSDRVCHACRRKIRNVCELFNFIRRNLQKEKESSTSTDSSDSSLRFKRLLPTTISSPDRSPRKRKGQKTNAEKTRDDFKEGTTARKSLGFNSTPPPNDLANDNIASSTPEENNISPQQRAEIASAHLNVEDLLESSTTEVKVVVVKPSGKVDSFSRFEDKTKSMIVNLCKKQWKTVANLAFSHPNVRDELSEPLQKVVCMEFQEFCNTSTDSVLKKTRPEDLAAFSNKVLVHEVEVWCPFWMDCVRGACNVGNSSELDIKKTNSMALITSIAARGRNPTMSAVAYRISGVLFHSGVKYEEDLGVCMSPDMIVEFQRKMGESCESKVCHWKKEIEKVKVAGKLLNEVKEKQVGHHEDDIMRVDVDFSEQTLKNYKFFKPDAFELCQEHLSSVANGRSVLTDQDLAGASENIATTNLPYYRYFENYNYFLCCELQ